MLDLFQHLGRTVLNVFERLGRAVIFFTQLLAGFPSLFFRPYLVIAQIYAVGVLSLTIIIVSGFFVGNTWCGCFLIFSA